MSQQESALPQAAIVIPHYNDVVRLRKCLSALLPQILAAKFPVEVVVADNASSVELGEIRADFPDVIFVVETEKGAAAARNAGVAATRAPCLFFIDSDCIPAPNWLERALTLGGEARMVGGKVALFDETPAPKSGAEAFETVFAFPQKFYVEKKKFSVTANLLITKEMFDRVGGFDGRVVEDFDWCIRAGKAGYPIVYEDDLIVFHPTRHDWQALSKKWRRTTNENYFLYGTSGSERFQWALRALAVAGSALLHLPRCFRAPSLSLTERFACAGTLLRLRGARSLWMLRQALFGDTRVR